MRPTLAASAARAWLGSGLLLVTPLVVGCSSTLPDSTYPPPAPSSGLPYIPLPNTDDWSDIDVEDDPEDAEPAAKPTIPAIDPALPAAPPTKLSLVAECAKPTCVEKAWVPTPGWLNAQPPGSKAILWMHQIKKGSTVSLPRHAGLEVLGVVLAGQVQAGGEETPQRPGLDVWGAFRAPGAGVMITAQADAQVLLVVATGDGSLQNALDSAKAKPWTVRWNTRGVPVATVRLDQAPAVSNQGGALQVRLAFADGAKRVASLGVLLGAPGLGMPAHNHPDKSWEHIAILQGAGSMQLGSQRQTVEPGAIFHIPPDTEHSFEPKGEAPVLAVQLYTPPGPEQRFLQGNGPNEPDTEDGDDEDEGDAGE